MSFNVAYWCQELFLVYTEDTLITQYGLAVHIPLSSAARSAACLVGCLAG